MIAGPPVLSRKLRLLQRASRRRSQRGSALFLSVMVISLMSAAGLYALRASSLASQAVGYNRLGIQTQYVAEFGARSMMADLAGNEQMYYEAALGVGLNSQQVDTSCRGNEKTETLAGAITSCRSWLSSDIASQMDHASNIGSASELFGKVSRANVTAGFKAEMTDVHTVEIPIPGHPEDGPLKYQRFTLTSRAYLKPQIANPDPDDSCSEELTGSMAMQQVRAQVVFGPVLSAAKTDKPEEEDGEE